MNKLTKIYSARPLVADARALRRCGRQALICVWRVDPASGRLVCSWESAEAGERAARNAGEPPPILAIAA